MPSRLQSVLDDLREATGATAADLTADEIESLVLACRRVDNPYAGVNADLMGRPVRVSRGVYLWPVTAGAQVWLAEFASAWWPRSSPMFAWARVHALAHAREPEAFAALVTKGKARLAVLKTALRLACSGRELARAVAVCYGEDPDAAPDAGGKQDKLRRRASTDFAALVARLEVASGIPAADWLWGRSLVSLAKSYVELEELSDALGGGRRERRIELDEAVQNLARACAAISRRLRVERGGETAKGGAA